MESSSHRSDNHSNLDADTLEYPPATWAGTTRAATTRGGKAVYEEFDQTTPHIPDREDICSGYTHYLDRSREQSTYAEHSSANAPTVCPMSPIPEEATEKASGDDASSSIYSQEGVTPGTIPDRPDGTTEGRDVETPNTEYSAEQSEPKETTNETPDHPAAEPTPSKEQAASTPSEDPEEPPFDRQGPDENIVDHIHRKHDTKASRRRAKKKAAAARAAKEREERQRGSETPPPPQPRAPNPAKDFNPRRPGTIGFGFRGPARFYTKAHVLTVHWKSVCAGLPGPVKQFKEVIRRYYGYEVTHCVLPAHREAPLVLAQALAELVGMYGNNAKDTLVMLHYVGPSRTNADSFRICAPAFALCPSAVEVDLHALLCDSILGPMFNPDVLCLLDCAYAVEDAGRPCEGKEILAASTEPTKCMFFDRKGGGEFTRSIAAKLEAAMGSVQFYTDELEERLVKDAVPKTWSFTGMFGRSEERKKTATLPRTRSAAGLKTGLGPSRRFIFLAPLVTPWQYCRMKNQPSKKAWLEVEEVEATCFVCGKLSAVGGFAHKHMCGRVPVRGVRGHTYDVAQKGTEMDEIAKKSPSTYPVAPAA